MCYCVKETLTYLYFNGFYRVLLARIQIKNGIKTVEAQVHQHIYFTWTVFFLFTSLANDYLLKERMNY